jgi:hypothetical protein
MRDTGRMVDDVARDRAIYHALKARLVEVLRAVEADRIAESDEISLRNQ